MSQQGAIKFGSRDSLACNRGGCLEIPCRGGPLCPPVATHYFPLAGWMPRVFAEVAGEHWCNYLMAGTTFGSRTTRSTFHPAARYVAGVYNGWITEHQFLVGEGRCALPWLRSSSLVTVLKQQAIHSGKLLCMPTPTIHLPLCAGSLATSSDTIAWFAAATFAVLSISVRISCSSISVNPPLPFRRARSRCVAVRTPIALPQ